MSVAGVGRRSPPTRQARRVDKDDFLFFLGRADEEKAPHLAVEAARRAGRRLVMCATTKNERERAYWAANVEPILGDDVEVHGECPQDQKADLLARASALLFPIQWEERFSADAMVAGYEDVYQRVLTMGPQHSGSYVALTCSP
jgi:glycosyltransferase involved in cell wall biosynthesis